MTTLNDIPHTRKTYRPRDGRAALAAVPSAPVVAPAALVNWHNPAPFNPNGRWTIKNVLPYQGLAILASEWGFGKTYVALELARCVMLGELFAGQRVKRTGGVLWLAAEGEGEIRPRLEGLRVDGRIPEGEPLPFAWASNLPSLLQEGAERQLIDIVRDTANEMAKKGHELALIVVDTIAAAAGFKDENDAAECQRAMNVLNALGRAGGCLVLAIDHYGKTAESGVRGSSAKEANADATIVISGTRDPKTNVVRDRGLVKRKVRGGVPGVVADFDLRQVVLGMDEDNEPVTTAVVDWLGTASRAADTNRKLRTPALKLFFSSLDEALADHGRDVRPFEANGPSVRAVAQDAHRDKYLERCATDANPDSKRKQYRRHLQEAINRELVTAREVNGSLMIWKP